MCHDWHSSPSQSLGHMQGQDARRLEKSEEGREYLAREQARVDARKQAQSSTSSHKRDVSEEMESPTRKSAPANE